MKIGLDLHNVIDANPEFFKKLSHDLISCGWEVHIITGKRFKLVEQELKSFGIEYTHFYSITEEEEKNGSVVTEDEKGDPWMDKDVWNTSKARYCKEKGIDLHIDDSATYGEFFKTPFAKYKKCL